MRSRRLVVVFAIAALVCASAALADPLDPKVKYTNADQARAKAVMLQQSDLGTAWANRSGGDPSLKAPICPSLRPNYSKLTLTGHAESVFDNGNGGIQVTSDVEVWKTAAQAKQHMDALLKPALPNCIRFALAKSLASATGVTMLPAKVHNLGKLPADTSVSYRVPVAIKSGGQTVIVNSDYVLLRRGRTEVYINVTAPSTDQAQVKAFEQRIAKTLARRIRS